VIQARERLVRLAKIGLNLQFPPLLREVTPREALKNLDA
jgi:hypothetical protein